MNRLSTIIGGVLLLQVLSANAQTVYVGDRLQVGLHAQSTLSSKITELLSSGTELQLLESNGVLAKVRTPLGQEGWVDANYISSEQPARERVQAMEEELAGAQAALADLQAKLVVMEQRPQQLENDRAADESAKLTSEALREIQILAEENQRLKQEIAEFEAMRRMEQERTANVVVANEPAAPAASTTAATPAATLIDNSDDKGMDIGLDIIADIKTLDLATLKHWRTLLIASVLLLAFSLGGWLVDWRVRQRHGGFRI